MENSIIVMDIKDTSITIFLFSIYNNWPFLSRILIKLQLYT